MKRLAAIALLLGCSLSIALSADWPQWRGAARDGHSGDTGLLKEWPREGPRLLWKNTEIGHGYSTPSVVGDRVYVLIDRNNQEYAVALDARDGKQVWSTPIGRVGRNTGPQFPGTRATPAVAGKLLVALSSDGDLVCLETDKGKERWKKSLRQDFDGRCGAWAYCESPLVDGDAVICAPGGRTATVLALKVEDGSVIWKCALPSGEATANSSPIAAEVGGQKQYVFFLSGGLVGVDAKTGKQLWRSTASSSGGGGGGFGGGGFGGRGGGGGSSNISTPIFHDGKVFSMGKMRSVMLDLKAEKDSVKVSTAYDTREVSYGQGGAVQVGDYLYGYGGTSLACIEFATGKVKWQNRSVGKGSICYADGMLYVRSERDGRVALVEATPDGYKEKGRLEPAEKPRSTSGGGGRPKGGFGGGMGGGQAWSHPVVANGCLYLRDQNVLLCYDVRDRKAK